MALVFCSEKSNEGGSKIVENTMNESDMNKQVCFPPFLHDKADSLAARS